MLHNAFPTPIYEGNINNHGVINDALVKYITKIRGDSDNIVTTKRSWNYDCGVWTSSHINPQIFDTKDSSIESIFNEIKIHIRSFISNWIDLKNPSNVSIVTSWINVQGPNQFQEFHEHLSDSVPFSGTYYIKVPPTSGDIVFRRNDFKVVSIFSDFFPTEVSLSVCPGMLLLFPSWLDHKVCRNDSTDDRISLAFNFDVERR